MEGSQTVAVVSWWFLSVWICLYVSTPASTWTTYIHMFVSLGWKRGVASVPGRPPDSSGGGQRHQGGGSAGAAYTQEAAAGGAGSQCKAFYRLWGPAGSQVPSQPYSFFQFLPLYQSPPAPLVQHWAAVPFSLNTMWIWDTCQSPAISPSSVLYMWYKHYHFNSQESLA